MPSRAGWRCDATPIRLAPVPVADPLLGVIQAASGEGLTTELRLSAGASGTVEVTLRLATEGSTPVSAGLFERALPSDHLWSRLDEKELAPQPVARGWWLQELVRRTRVRDLRASWGSVFDQADPGGILTAAPGDMSWLDFRSFPPLDAANAAKRAGRVNPREPNVPYCRPEIAPLRDGPPDDGRLFREMRHAAPATLSFTWHPFDPGAADEDRAIAFYLRRWELAEAGRTTGRDNRVRLYERYSAPAELLCRLTVRVVAPERARATALAHCAAERFGGLTAVEVRPPVKLEQSDLSDPPPDDRARARAWFKIERIDPDPDYEGFLARAPYLFSFDEACRVFRLPVSGRGGLAGHTTQTTPPFAEPPVRLLSGLTAPPPDRMRIGRVRSGALSVRGAAKASDSWYTVEPKAVTRHVMVCGTTGSGKSVSTLFQIMELNRLGIKTLSVEPVKGSYYYDLRAAGLSDVVRWHFEGEPRVARQPSGFVAFDPMRIPAGCRVGRRIADLSVCFQAGIPLTELMSLVLTNGLKAYYTDKKEEGGCELDLFDVCKKGTTRVDSSTGAVYPSFATFKEYFLTKFLTNEFRAGSGAQERADEWREMFHRRFEFLAGSVLGVAFAEDDRQFRENPACYDPLGPLMALSGCLELDALGDDDSKALMMAFLLTGMFERLQAQAADARRWGPPARDGRDLGIDHCLIVEEAHRLLARGQPASGSERAGLTASARVAEMFAQMACEIREYRQGLYIVEQSPTKLIADALKNTNMKMVHKLISADEQEYVAGGMKFDRRHARYAAELRAGQAIVFDEALGCPILIEVPAPAEWPNLFHTPTIEQGS